ncbi:hypothetical protein OPV22_033397 [Ensete ventricosum]|uniref:Histone deacetylase interacting domain-containing protein n=1 Tax=Ensete ventricosum TaxID=4639 RepID=A0AAV8PPQ0_ENSVE|nr:hypothetical protein OPV22_033397 [Ensete ventricosum]
MNCRAIVFLSIRLCNDSSSGSAPEVVTTVVSQGHPPDWCHDPEGPSPRDDDHASSTMWPKQSRGASSSHSDSKPGRDDAREFLAVVKRTLHDKAHTYDQFLDLMKSLKTSSLFSLLPSVYTMFESDMLLEIISATTDDRIHGNYRLDVVDQLQENPGAVLPLCINSFEAEAQRVGDMYEDGPEFIPSISITAVLISIFRQKRSTAKGDFVMRVNWPFTKVYWLSCSTSA